MTTHKWNSGGLSKERYRVGLPVVGDMREANVGV